MRQFYEEESEPKEATFALEGATIIRERPDAVLVRAPALNGDVWVPQSVVHDDSEVWNAKNAGPGKLVVRAWYAQKRKWT